MSLEAIKEFCERFGVTILNRCDFPELLLQISDPPERLFIQGDLSCLTLPSLGVVGTRRPSSYGMRSATSFSKTLAELGFCITSGLARGIDSCAHRGALLGQGKTIAVLAHGHDEIYPRDNLRLAREILEKGGILLSEYPPFTGCRKFHFPARNRIVAGLSKGVLVIEASEKSGSLITAEFASDFGREVYVVPGPYDDSNFLGSHRLIQTGAKLAGSTADILVEYPEIVKTLIPQALTETDRVLKEKLKKEFSFQELFSVSLEGRFEAGVLLKKWMEFGWVAEISPQFYTWLNEAS